MAKNRITAIGLELEGAWARPPANVKHDGSVRGFDSGLTVGEVASAPIATLEQAEAWLRENYPEDVNDSCGFHIHISLPPGHYSKLMDNDFYLKFLSEMEEFYHRFRGAEGFDLFRSRLDGQNRYCQKVFRPEQQLFRMEAYGEHSTHPRYSQLNFCFGRHGTMETRLYPCFPNATHSVEGLKTFVNCVNEFLATVKSERPYKISITADESAENVISQPVAA